MSSSGRYPLYSVCSFQHGMSNSGSPATAISSCAAVNSRSTCRIAVAKVPRSGQDHVPRVAQSETNAPPPPPPPFSPLRTVKRYPLIAVTLGWHGMAVTTPTKRETDRQVVCTLMGTMSESPAAIAIACPQQARATNSSQRVHGETRVVGRQGKQPTKGQQC